MILLSFAALLAAQPADQPTQSPPIGQRTGSPAALLAELGLAPDQDDLAVAIAEADKHPLGSLQNPVRVGGPGGERAYIARLRCSDGSAPRVGQRGNMGVGAFGTIVDSYPLDCGGAAPGKTNLVLDMYHEEHVENRAPPGFTIQPR
jgi:hypothetical protein